MRQVDAEIESLSSPIPTRDDKLSCSSEEGSGRTSAAVSGTESNTSYHDDEDQGENDDNVNANTSNRHIGEGKEVLEVVTRNKATDEINHLEIGILDAEPKHIDDQDETTPSEALGQATLEGTTNTKETVKSETQAELSEENENAAEGHECEDIQVDEQNEISGSSTKGQVDSQLHAVENLLSTQAKEHAKVSAVLNEMETVLLDAAAILENAHLYCEVVDDFDDDDDYDANNNVTVQQVENTAHTNERCIRDSMVCFGDHSEADSICSNDSQRQYSEIPPAGGLIRGISDAAVGRLGSSRDCTSHTSYNSRSSGVSHPQIIIEIPRRIMNELFEKWQEPPAEISFISKPMIVLMGHDLQAARQRVLSALYAADNDANMEPMPTKYFSIPLGDEDVSEDVSEDGGNSSQNISKFSIKDDSTKEFSTAYVSDSDRRRFRFSLFAKVLFLLGSVLHLTFAIHELQWAQDVQNIPFFVLRADDDWTWEEYNQAQILQQLDAAAQSSFGRSAKYPDHANSSATTTSTRAPYRRQFVTWRPGNQNQGNRRYLQNTSLDGFTVPTVPELFTIIQAAIQFNPLRMEVQYDLRLGFPSRIYINFNDEPVWRAGNVFYWTVFDLNEITSDALVNATDGLAYQSFTSGSEVANLEATTVLQQELDAAVGLWSNAGIVNYKFRCNGLVATDAGSYPWHVSVREGSVIRVRDNFNHAVETDLFQSFYENEMIFPSMESELARSYLAESSPLSEDWDFYLWSDLPPQIHSAASTLGYDETTWNNGDAVATDGVAWEDLTTEQQAAATTIGYAENWNEPTIQKPFHHAAMYKDVQWVLYSWNDLPLHVQIAALDLGYDGQRWDDRMTVPLMSVKWDSLSQTQKRAALGIGYSQESWDQIQQAEIIAQAEYGERPPVLVDRIQNMILIVAAACFVFVGIVESLLGRKPHHLFMSIAGGFGVGSAVLVSSRHELSTILSCLAAHFFLFTSLSIVKSQLSSPPHKTKKWKAMADILFAVGAFNDAILSYFRTLDSAEFALGIAGCAVAGKILWCWSSMIHVMIASLSARGVFGPPPKTETCGFPMETQPLHGAFPSAIEATAALSLDSCKDAADVV